MGLQDRTSDSLVAKMWSKVPLVTLAFWIIKIMATTVGETGADLLSSRLGFGLTNTSWIMTGVFAVFLVLQLRAKTYVPVLYWITVVLISVVGTLISDNLVDGMGIRVDSTDRRNALVILHCKESVENFSGSFPIKCFPRSCVDRMCNCIQLCCRVTAKICPFWKVLPQQAIGIFI
jgi:hypothetical protein